MPLSLDRRAWLKGAGLTGAGCVAGLSGAGLPARAATLATGAAERIAIADDGWALWLDHEARWLDDAIYLPDDVRLDSLPVHAPSGGWAALNTGDTRKVTLPATVEQYYWGKFGLRPYTDEEYKYASDDPEPKNGNYIGVSWWSKTIDIPASAAGKQAWLHIRGARMRAEVFLNEQLVGYSIMSELPVDCDLTRAMKPGQPNRLAIRITNPGGRLDWKDSNVMTWDHVKLYESHGFGGLDRGLTLSLHPPAGRFADAWVLNTPQPRTVTAHAELELKAPADAEALKTQLSLSLTDVQGQPVAADIALQDVAVRGNAAIARFVVTAPPAKLWDIDTPNLYVLRFTWAGGDAHDVRFGFRWYSPEGIGTNALLRLNGRRIKAYSAISWGYWGFNGLWPTPELARREVTAARSMGLNILSFHRNVGKPEVLDAQDEMGLLRSMEPGAGRQAIGKDLKPGDSLSPADAFARDFMVAKCRAMVRAFRSHPSLVHYTLQNEVSANLANPDVERVLRAMHELDPSRTVILNDGFVARGAAQAMFLPYDDHMYRSDVEKAGGWWVQHQSAGDQWYDKFYVDKDDFVHRQTMPEAIVEFGEMEGCAVCDDHVKMVAQILQAGGESYDLLDHKEIVAGYNGYLDKWGFRQAFPTTEAAFLSIGRKQFDSWHEYLENIRICDQVDMAAISGWESTAIENHSGIVDNLRNPHSDPQLLRLSLQPVRPVAKQRKLTYVTGEAAEVDIWLLNDTGAGVSGELTLSLADPAGRAVTVATYAAPAYAADQMSYLLAEKVTLPAFTAEGVHRIRLELSGRPDAAFVREVWVTRTDLQPKRPLRIAVSGVAKSFRDRLAVPGVTFEDFQPGQAYDGLIASGLKADEIAKRQVGDVTGNESPSKTAKPVLVQGELPPEVLAAVKAGTPLLAAVPDDGLADGVAKQLSALGLFSYAGQVGDLRAPWMGNWTLLKSHALWDGIPSNMACSVWHQVPGQPSNGLIIDGDNIDVVAAYSRDHARRLGAASFTVKKDGMKLLFHRMPDIAEALQKRWLVNAVHWLAEG